MQLEQTLRTLCALPAVSGFEMQAAHTVAELFRPYCDTVDVDKNGNVIGSLSCGKEGAKPSFWTRILTRSAFLSPRYWTAAFCGLRRSAAWTRACCSAAR